LNNSWFYGAEHDKKRTTIEIESDLGFDLGLFVFGGSDIKL
jgi:hypothetical protein